MKKAIKINYEIFFLMLLFSFIVLSRILFLNSDLPHLDYEEMASGYNARNKILFGTWDSGGGWYQPAVYMPLSNLLTYISFSILDVGIFQLRLPFAVLSILSFLVFYFAIRKEFNKNIALLVTFVFSYSYPVLMWNRTALNENLFIFLATLTLFFVQKILISKKALNYFLLGIVLSLNLAVKIHGIIFILITALFIGFHIIKADKSTRFKLLIWFSLGNVFSFIFFLCMLLQTQSFQYIEHIYRRLDSGVKVGVFNWLARPTLFMPNVILNMFPWIFLLVMLYIITVRTNKNFRASKISDYVLLWIFVIPIAPFLDVNFSYKRLFIFLPFVFFFMAEMIETSWNKYKSNTIIYTNKFIPVTVFFLLIFVLIHHTLYGTVYEFLTSMLLPALRKNNALPYHSEGYIALLLYSSCILALFISIILSIISRENNLKLSPKYLFYVTISLILLSSVRSTYLLISKICIATKQNLAYQTSDNQKSLKKYIPEHAKIVCQENALRVFGYESKHKFLFIHDGFPTKLNDFFDIAERQNIKYFIASSEDWPKAELNTIYNRFPNAELLKTVTYKIFQNPYSNGVYIRQFLLYSLWPTHKPENGLWDLKEKYFE